MKDIYQDLKARLFSTIDITDYLQVSRRALNAYILDGITLEQYNNFCKISTHKLINLSFKPYLSYL